MTDEPFLLSIFAFRSAPDADARSYIQLWAESLAQVLGQIAGSAFAMDIPAGVSG